MDARKQNGTSEEIKEKPVPINEAPAKKMTLRRSLPQILATSAKNILLLAYGMTLGFPTIVIPSVMMNSADNATSYNSTGDDLKLTLEQISWYSSINLLCVPIGCLFSGAVTQPFGRKPSMLVLNFPFIAAWLVNYFANSVSMLYLALAITGLSGGLLEAPVLTYVAEITEPELRGILSATSSMCVILGVFIQFIFGTFLTWRQVALLNIVFPLTAVICITFVPESPHWLLSRGRTEEAQKSLQWLRGWVSPAEVQTELLELNKSFTAESTETKKRPHWRAYLKRSFVQPFLLVIFAFFLGHFGGITTLQTYAVSIFATVGSPLDKFVSTVLLGLSQLMGSLVCVGTVKMTGKRPLALFSTCSGGICFIAVVCYSYFGIKAFPWFPLVGLVAAAFLSHVCLRLLPWILIGEVFPNEVRGTASGACGGVGYILGFTANKSYLYSLSLLGLQGTFLMYAATNILGCVALYFFLPETEGLTLHEIEGYFKKKPPKTKWASSNPAFDSESHL